MNNMTEKEQLRRLKVFVNEILNMVEDATLGVNIGISADDISNVAYNLDIIAEYNSENFKKADWLKDENDQPQP